MKPLIFMLSITLLTACSRAPQETATRLSPELAAAREKALTLCAGCHGPAGTGTSDLIPNLAGQKPAYMVKQMMDFRSGKRGNHPPMSHIARMLTDAEIDAISRWYSGF